MTLVLTIRGRNTVWLAADRRLTWSDGRPPVDDATKLLELNTIDGSGVLAYAGLGVTAGNTQPSDWMSNVLRGLGGITFEQSLLVLAEAAAREMPLHLRELGATHTIMAPAFVNGRGRLYTVDTYLDTSGIGHSRLRSHVYGDVADRPALRMGIAGSGTRELDRRRIRWHRLLLHLVQAEEAGKVTNSCVADAFARALFEVSENDATVGPRSIVAWRRRPNGPLNINGHLQYVGTMREAEIPWLPAISNGIDVRQLVGTTWSHSLERLEKYGYEAAIKPDFEELDRQLNAMDWGPDDRLR